jgi:hypothetical protein
MKLGLAIASALVVGATTGVVRADDALPVIVEYVAPGGCASTEAFHALLQAQIARMPNPDRPWRFSVVIRQREDFEGTLTSESGNRVLHAGTCDEVVAALTLVIAMATPAAVTPPPPPPIPPPIQPPVELAVPLSLQPTWQRSRDQVVQPVADDSATWRMGARFQDWTNGAWLSAVGPSAVVSVEPRWGAYRMMFELGVGVLVTQLATGVDVTTQQSPALSSTITWGVVDFQVCPLDMELGSTGLAVLGCTRVAGAVDRDSIGDSGGALWFGGGGRLRWQSPWHVYIEAHANGLWGTQSSPLYGSPGWMDFGATLGARI